MTTKVLANKLQVPFFCLILVALSTCITPLDVEPSDFENLLVVQGFITDDFGPHEIRISRIARFSGILEGGVIEIEGNADVRIIDQDGISVKLDRLDTVRKETIRCGLGFASVKTDYRTPADFRGEIGNIYTLEIRTEQEIYRSEPQTIIPTQEIDSLSLQFKELPSLDPIVPESGVEVFATWQDPPDEENYYFWRLNGIYRIFTEDRSRPPEFCCPFDIDGAEDCWIIENNIRTNVLSFADERVNGKKITKSVGIIIDNALRFGNLKVPASRQYYVEVEQYNVTRESFEFNERIQTLNDINGEIFDPPPLSISGNIRNVTNPNRKAVGYFGAFAKQTKDIFIPKSLLKFIKRFPQPCQDCRTLSGAQLEIPEPYKN